MYLLSEAISVMAWNLKYDLLSIYLYNALSGRYDGEDTAHWHMGLLEVSDGAGVALVRTAFVLLGCCWGDAT